MITLIIKMKNPDHSYEIPNILINRYGFKWASGTISTVLFGDSMYVICRNKTMTFANTSLDDIVLDTSRLIKSGRLLRKLNRYAELAALAAVEQDHDQVELNKLRKQLTKMGILLL